MQFVKLFLSRSVPKINFPPFSINYSDEHKIRLQQTCDRIRENVDRMRWKPPWIESIKEETLHELGFSRCGVTE
jgi:hypothetical protein